MHMNRDYIHWLESLPCNRGIRDRQVNVWMSGYAPLPDEIDLEHSREMQERWVVRDCPDGVLGRFWRRLQGNQSPALSPSSMIESEASA